MTTMKQKILSILTSFPNKRMSAEDIFIHIRSGIDPSVKMTTITRSLYDLVKSGVINRAGDGHYALGDYRANLDWLTEL